MNENSRKREELNKKWQKEREVHKQLISKIPVFQKLQYQRLQKEKEEVDVKKRIIMERRQNFLPIVTKEIHEFAAKCD